MISINSIKLEKYLGMALVILTTSLLNSRERNQFGTRKKRVNLERFGVPI